MNIAVGSIASSTAIVSSPALTPAIAGAGAELLALRPELEGIISEFLAQQAIDAGRRERWEAVCERAGLPNIPWEEWEDKDAWVEHSEKRSALHSHPDLSEDYAAQRSETDEDGASIIWTSILDRMYALVDRIMAMRPTTVAGLGVIARAASLDYDSVNEVEDGQTKSLIRIVCDFCDVVPFFAENEGCL
jgi:hypothetical protein